MTKLPPRKDWPGGAGRASQHPPLCVREAAGGVIPPRLLSSKVDDEVADDQRVAPLVTVAAQDGADAGHHLAGTEWLRHIIVGPQLKSTDLVFLPVPSGEHDDRHRHQRPDPAGHFPSIQAREHQVQHHQVRGRGLDLPDRGLTVSSGEHTIAVPLKIRAEQFHNLRLVLHDKYRRHACSLSGHTIPPRRARRQGGYGLTPRVTVTSTRCPSRSTTRWTFCPGCRCPTAASR